MSQPNPHWCRWIISSLTEYYKTNVTTPLSLPFLVEGVDDRQPDFESASDRAELRYNGPFTQESSKNYWRLWMDVNILVTSHMDGEIKNRFTLENNVGVFHQYTDTCIPVYRYGDVSQTPENDGSLLGVLEPRSDKNASVKAHHFGQINKVERIRQSQVDAKFVMYICTEL